MEATEGLEGFVTILESGSLTAAARTLKLPRSTLSRQLSRLEKRMGVRLLHRTTRRLVPTRAGDELFQRARRIVDEARAAVEAVRRHDDVPRGLLRVTIPPLSSRDESLSDAILGFVARWPEVSVEVDASPRIVDLVQEGFDVAIRGSTAPTGTGLVWRSLARTDGVAVAAPSYLDQRGRPATVDDLAQHDLLLGTDARSGPERQWRLYGGGSVPVRGRLATNDLMVRRVGAVRGGGIAMLPHLAVVRDIEAGALEPVLPGVLGFEGAAWVVYPEKAFLQAKVRAFIDHMVRWGETIPSPPKCPTDPPRRRRSAKP